MSIQKNCQGVVMMLTLTDSLATCIFIAFQNLIHNYGQNLNIPIFMADNLYDMYIGKIRLVRDVGLESLDKVRIGTHDEKIIVVLVIQKVRYKIKKM